MGLLLCKESQQGVYVILLTKYSMVSSLVLLSSFIPSSHVTVTQYIPIYFIITTFVPSSRLLHRDYMACALVTTNHMKTQNERDLDTCSPLRPFPMVPCGIFFCSNQQLQEEIMSSYFLSAVVNTSILS